MGTRLYRSRDDRMLAGVAGGLADLWDVDPSLVRIVWAVLVVLTGGLALVVYIVMAIVVPEEGSEYLAPPPGAAGGPAPGAPAADAASTTGPGAANVPQWPADWREQRRAEREARRDARQARRAARGDTDGRTATIVIGALLVIVGFAFLVREYLPTIDFDYVWPIALVALGLVVLVSALRPGGSNGSRGPS